MCVCERERERETYMSMYDREREGERRGERESLYARNTCMALSHSINDNESCADLLLERMDNVSINSADKSGR